VSPPDNLARRPGSCSTAPRPTTTSTPPARAAGRGSPAPPRGRPRVSPTGRAAATGRSPTRRLSTYSPGWRSPARAPREGSRNICTAQSAGRRASQRSAARAVHGPAPRRRGSARRGAQRTDARHGPARRRCAARAGLAGALATVVAAAQGMWNRVAGRKPAADLERSPASWPPRWRAISRALRSLTARLDDVVSRSAYRAASDTSWHYNWAQRPLTPHLGGARSSRNRAFRDEARGNAYTATRRQCS